MNKFIFGAMAVLLVMLILAVGCVKSTPAETPEPKPAWTEGIIEDIDVEESTITIVPDEEEEVILHITPETRIILDDEDVSLLELAEELEEEEEAHAVAFYTLNDFELALIDVELED